MVASLITILCLITHNHGLVSSSLWTALFQQDYKNKSTQWLPLSLFAKGLLQEKKIVSLPNFTVSCTYEYTMGFVVFCVWKCSLMSTTHLVHLSFHTAMWVRFFLPKSFQFLTSKAICNCKLSETSIGSENLFLGFCLFIYSNQKQFNYHPVRQVMESSWKAAETYLGKWENYQSGPLPVMCCIWWRW